MKLPIKTAWNELVETLEAAELSSEEVEQLRVAFYSGALAAVNSSQTSVMFELTMFQKELASRVGETEQ